MLGHAVFMSNRLGCVPDDYADLKAHISRLESRPAFVGIETADLTAVLRPSSPA